MIVLAGGFFMDEEWQWIQEVLSGNKQAYAHIINKYKNQLYATILRMTRQLTIVWRSSARIAIK